MAGNGPWSARQAAQVSQRLRWLREERGWAIRELGRRAGLSPSTVGGIERGAQPDLGSMLALQRAFGCSSLEELLGPFPPSKELGEP